MAKKIKPKTTQATLQITCFCECPECEHYFDVFDKVKDLLEENNQARDIEKQIECPKCKKDFILTDIYY